MHRHQDKVLALQGNVKRTLRPFLTSLLLAILSLATTLPVNQAHSNSTVGLVCVSTVTTSCPATLPTFTADPGSQLTVRVVIQGSDAFDSYSVAIGANQSILKVASIDATGGMLQNLNYMICTGQQSDPCAYWLGLGPGDVRVSASGTVTQAPTTGLLFTVTYNVLARTAGSPVVLFDQVSPSGPSCECALLSNSVTRNSFMSSVQGASFANPSMSGSLVGDVDNDCVVDIRDAAIIAYAFGATPVSSNWIPAADLNRDGIVSIIDAAMLAFNFGQRC